MLRIIVILGVVALVWVVFFAGSMRSTVPGPDRPTEGSADAPPGLTDRLEAAGDLVLNGPPRDARLRSADRSPAPSRSRD